MARPDNAALNRRGGKARKRRTATVLFSYPYLMFNYGHKALFGVDPHNCLSSASDLVSRDSTARVLTVRQPFDNSCTGGSQTWSPTRRLSTTLSLNAPAIRRIIVKLQSTLASKKYPSRKRASQRAISSKCLNFFLLSLRSSAGISLLVESINSDDAIAFLSKDWDFTSVEQDVQVKDIGLSKPSRHRISGQRLSNEVKSLIGEGNQAYIDGDLPEAMRIMLEIIRIEPRAPSAWAVLAQCYEDTKQDQQALKLRIMGAHLEHDSDEWVRLAQQSKNEGCNLQALYCLGKAARLDSMNVNVQWDRASIARETGDLRTARAALLAVLQQLPHDLTVLSEIRTVLIDIPDLATCITLFKGAFEHYQKMYPSGQGPDPSGNRVVPGGGFGSLEILVLADLYNVSGENARAIDVIRRGFRWLQGRTAHRYWDACDDDREYDRDEFNRATDSNLQPGGFPLDVNARHRLAIARIKVGDTKEARLHVSAILSEDVLDYAPLFVEIADTFFEDQMYADALPIYELLGSDRSTSNSYVILRTAECLRQLDELGEAADIYEHLQRLGSLDNKTKMQLAEIYEILNEPRKALNLVHEVIASRKRVSQTSETAAANISQLRSASLFLEDQATPSKPHRGPVTLDDLRGLEAAVERDNLKDYQQIKELWPNISKPEIEGQWLLHAERMIEGFRRTTQLFSNTRSYRGMFPSRNRSNKKDQEADEDQTASRLQLELGGCTNETDALNSTNIFRGLDFQDWFQLIFHYCFMITKRGQFDSAHEILRHVSKAIPYRSSQFQDSICLAISACAVATERFSVVVEQFRQLRVSHQFNNEPLRIFLATMASGLRSTDAFLDDGLHKALGRAMKLCRIVTDPSAPEMTSGDSPSKRFFSSIPETEQGDELDVQTSRISRCSPVVMAVYAEMSILTKKYQSAIYYLLRVYDSSPNDPTLCLCLAIAYFGRAMQRNSDNRHHLITQGVSFLTRYRELRQEPTSAGEVEFNFGRAFQQLGLTSVASIAYLLPDKMSGLYSYAVKHYEKVLEISAVEATDSKNRVSREAAYNLSLIYNMTGAIPLAESIYRRWLSL
ncbi:hypothetical protein B0H19DRAFT_1131683 [Mycena capillaripes]|nr:hypothetical protein B0H19DRAFT_1131683 [Mycena capillaripes]